MKTFSIICAVLITALVVYLIADVINVPQQTSIVTIVGTEHQNAYTVVQYVHSGDVNVPITTFYPEHFCVKCNLKNEEVFSITCEPKLYYSCTNGQRILISYRIGKYSHGVRLANIEDTAPNAEASR